MRQSLINVDKSETITDMNISKIIGIEMRLLRKNLKYIVRRDKIRNKTVINQLNVKPVNIVIEERPLGWLGHIHRIEKASYKKVYEARIQTRIK